MSFRPEYDLLCEGEAGERDAEEPTPEVCLARGPPAAGWLAVSNHRQGGHQDGLCANGGGSSVPEPARRHRAHD